MLNRSLLVAYMSVQCSRISAMEQQPVGSHHIAAYCSCVEASLTLHHFSKIRDTDMKPDCHTVGRKLSVHITPDTHLPVVYYFLILCKLADTELM